MSKPSVRMGIMCRSSLSQVNGMHSFPHWMVEISIPAVASPQTWVLAMKNPRILRGLRRFYRNDQDH
jgi:hypothetical protein